ncbi:hypothetical protein ACRCPS_18210 [Pseudomonas aeruginosa]
MQLAFSMFDNLTEGFVPIRRTRPRRAVSAQSATLPELSQLTFLDLLDMDEKDIEVSVWTDDDIATLREGILREALHVLLDNRAAMSTRRDRWKWINDDAEKPFSFKICATVCEVNWEDLRASLISLCRHHKVLQDLQAA